ncbi:carbohydrate ABC transporter permease [Glycomyces algeriensis]|uniref:Sugar ABC transporter permease n=1 Tax=Glycomyces algeriensis TaxID=256037 RepID=A0A9W6GA47_9ACTN|nr:sugar ABC transporter permease [Glycomyces algeriensis]MDA1364291.1 sugar ABC transporter permease [Glycomyces algeriensis]MDR7350321.1 raffinose/stachyose/melibiose transport system permease protein [Glycomyces algeriensis]GLI43029.1 sugar ABC transporter permease [Glycomyces algeriensis]
MRTAGIKPPVWFLAPAVLLYLAIVLIPNGQGLFFSFTDWDGLGSTWAPVGIDNYRAVLSDPNSLQAILNTFMLTLIVTIGQNVIGLLLALGVNSRVKSRHLLRLVFFLPVVLTPIVAGYLWKYLLTPNGTLNGLLESTGLGAWRQNWLGDPEIVLYSICAAVIWQGAGYSMVIYLAGLQAVPAEALEAAAIDGAGAARRTWSITLPLINGAIVVNLLLCVIGNLKQFDTVFSMSEGGPSGASETMATIVYKTAFTYLEYPNALAQGAILTLLVGVIGFVQFRLTQRKALA